MKKIICQYKKNYTHPITSTLPEKYRRRKVPISTLAAIFKLYNEKKQTINIMYSAFDTSEEKMEAEINTLEGLLKRLEDFKLSHRFDVAGARRDIANQRYRT